MLDNIISVSLYAAAIISGLMVFTGTIIHQKNSPLKRILVSFILITTSTIIGTTFFDMDSQMLFLLHYLLFGIVNLMFINSDIKISSLLMLEAVVMITGLLVPIESFVVVEGSFITPNLILMLVGLGTMIAVYLRIKTLAFDVNLNATFGLVTIAIIVCFFAPEELSLPINAVLLAMIAWYNIGLVLKENSILHTDLESKLYRLENEFNDEVRRAVNKHTFHLKEVQERMSQINKIDNLTKSYNKKAILNIIEELTLNKKNDEFTIIMFDLDNFKTLNDTLGHVQGDMCLKTLSMIAKESIRTSDYLGRYGGDEFIIVLPKSKLSTAITIAERFRKNIDEQTQPHFTVSVGLATFPDDGSTTKELLGIADTGLYLSKEKGRNAVSYHNPELNKKY